MLILKLFNRVSTELGHFVKENKWFFCPEEARGNNSQNDIWLHTLYWGRKVTETRGKKKKNVAGKPEIKIQAFAWKKPLSSQRSSGYTTSAGRHHAITPCIMRRYCDAFIMLSLVMLILRAGHFHLATTEGQWALRCLHRGSCHKTFSFSTFFIFSCLE